MLVALILIAGIALLGAYTLVRSGLETIGDVPHLPENKVPEEQSFVRRGSAPQAPGNTPKETSPAGPQMQGPKSGPPNY
jgi:hypothetical protein